MYFEVKPILDKFFAENPSVTQIKLATVCGIPASTLSKYVNSGSKASSKNYLKINNFVNKYNNSSKENQKSLLVSAMIVRKNSTAPLHWYELSIMCYLRRCNCSGCPVLRQLKDDCLMFLTIEKLLASIGKPKEEEIQLVKDLWRIK